MGYIGYFSIWAHKIVAITGKEGNLEAGMIGTTRDVILAYYEGFYKNMEFSQVYIVKKGRM
jgi:hypothetical protein